ncbi:MAG: amidohydrolase [Desulfobacteraceae bacterium]|nr:amidohydrolase [Desulfobacteraceae bacterium]
MASNKTLPDQMFADMALINGKVVTVDDEFSIARAIAVKQGKIAAVGTNEEIKALTGKNASIIDLKGKTVLPGINDAHIHSVLYGGMKPPLALDVSFPNVKSIKDIVEAVREKAKTVQNGEWIRGFGWDERYLDECVKDPKRHPTKHDLDSAAPDNPVCLSDFSVHTTWQNSRALELASITKDTVSPPGGEVEKDQTTGESTGILKDFAAIGLVMRVMTPYTREEKKEAILSAMKDLNSQGITSITDPALGPGGAAYQGGLMDAECISAYNDLYNESRLTVRVNFLYLCGEYGACSFKDFKETIPCLGITTGFGNQWLRLAGLKVFADGAPPFKTAWMNEEYVGGGVGSLALPGDNEDDRLKELLSIIEYSHKLGFQLGIHATGDRASETCTDAFIKAETAKPKDLRHYIIHGDFITGEYAEKMAENRIGICVQPELKSVLAHYMAELVGEERASRQFPLNSLIKAGAHVSASSDAPVTVPDWKKGMESAVLRESMADGRVSGPQERITIEDAIRMYTIEGAWQNHQEKIKGSIEAGKLADFCVLDQDILEIDPHRITEINTLMTIVEGNVVYDAGLE